MARRRDSSTPQPPPRLAVPLREADERISEQLTRGEELASAEINTWETLKQSRSGYYTWTEYLTELLRQLFTTSEVSEEFSSPIHLMFSVGGQPVLHEDVSEHRSDVQTHLRRLASIRERLPLYAPAGERSASSETAEVAVEKRVFVVHGHDTAAREATARLLERLGLESVILAEQPNQGRTIIEKFEASVDVSFAVVLMTGDDVGASAATPDGLAPRARQNVVLELGFFIGKLGRHRVAALVEPSVDVPSDIDGVLYIPYDPGGAWQLPLAREMRAAGLPIDLNQL